MNTKRTSAHVLCLALCGLTLLACQSGGGATSNGAAAKVVESYLQARAQSNLDKMINLSCAAWESQARVEATSFKSMKATLDGVSCKDNGADGNATLVACQGKIVTTYNGESRNWSVSDHQYKVVQDGGEWRMCGYK
jgi:hypothetical protein